MKRTWMVLVAAALAFGQTAWAENSIAVLDVAKVIASSEANKSANEKLKKMQSEIQAKINKMKTPLAEKERRLAERRSMMTSEQFLNEQTELRKEVSNFKFEAEEMQATLQAEGMKLRKEIVKTLSEVTAEVAKEKDIDVVLPSNGLVYVGDAIDVSEEVLKRLNKRLK